MIVPIILPFFLLMGGGVAVRSLWGVLSSAVPAALAFENWKLKKLQKLGIPNEMFFPEFTREEHEKREALRELRKEMEGNPKPILDDELNLMIVRVPHADPNISGTYAFISRNEMNAFVDSIRHLDLTRRTGPEFEALQDLLKDTSLSTEDIAFLWDGYDPVFVRLRKLSKARLADRDFMMLANAV